MKGIVITTKNDVSVVDFEEPVYKSLGEAVGGYFEIVHPVMLNRPFCMLCNDEGAIRGLEANPVGSVLYGSAIHGALIYGDIVLMKEGWTPEGLDFVDLEPFEIKKLLETVNEILSS